MRNIYMFGLAAVALGFGIANAAAGDDQRLAGAASGQSALMPAPSAGKFTSGFAAIKANKGLKQGGAFIDLPTTGYATEDGLGRPGDQHAWADGRTAIAAASTADAAKAADGQQALAAPSGMSKGGAHGFAAIKAAAGRGDSGLVGPSGQAGREAAGLQRPSGVTWSDRGRESLRADSVAPVPQHILGPSSGPKQ